MSQYSTQTLTCLTFALRTLVWLSLMKGTLMEATLLKGQLSTLSLSILMKNKGKRSMIQY